MASGEILVAIINKQVDFAKVRDEHWYRIPVSSANKWLKDKDRWPPQWIAFYQTQTFGSEAYSINYYAEVLTIDVVRRHELFPDAPPDKKSNLKYYKLNLGKLREMPRPILSRRWRRIVFIPTTFEKFKKALEINDLYNESPLEDRLWAYFKTHNIPAERQVLVTVEKENFFLDFAIYCEKGNIDVETDGDTWHANPEKSAIDNHRNNSLEATGWSVMRFTTAEIQEKAADYCVPKIVKKINNLGGVDEGKYMSRKISPTPLHSYQLGLFDPIEDEE